MTTDTKKESLWSKRLIFSTVCSTLGTALPFGYCMSVINSPAVHMQAWCNQTLLTRYNIEISAETLDIVWATVVSIYLIGGIVGGLTGAWISTYFGRKGTYFICCLLFLAAGNMFFASYYFNHVELLLLARFIAGLASGLTTSSLPLYQTELAPSALRGTVGSFLCIGLVAGLVIGQIMSLNFIFGTKTLWHVAMLFYCVFTIPCFAPIGYYCESPKWLYITKGRPDLARKELELLRGKNHEQGIEEELRAMATEAAMEQETSSFGEVCTNAKLRLPLIIVCVYNAVLQLSGINAIFYYSISIFVKAGFEYSVAEWLNLGVGVASMVLVLVSPYLMKAINRRPLMLSSSSGCALTLMGCALTLYYIDYGKGVAMACIGFIFVYLAFFYIAVGPMPYFIATELFEAPGRPVAMTLGSVVNWISNFLIGMTFPSLHRAFGALVFIPFSISCMLLFLLTLFYVPETRGKDPAVTASLVSRGFKSKIR